MNTVLRDFYPSVSLFIQERVGHMKEEFLTEAAFIVNTCNDDNTYFNPDPCTTPFCTWNRSCQTWLKVSEQFIDALMQMVEEAERLEDEPTIAEIEAGENLYLQQAWETMQEYINTRQGS